MSMVRILSRVCLLTNTLVDIVLRAWHDLEIFGSLTRPTLAKIDGNGGMDNNIIHAVLHEAIYCQG